MERLHFANKKTIAVMCLLFMAGIITCMIPVTGRRPHNLSGLCYCTIIMLWALTIKGRIIDPFVRKRILAACFFMIFLFFLRTCKFSFFGDEPFVLELLWNLYYVPMTAIPMFFYMAALRTVPETRSGGLLHLRKPGFFTADVREHLMVILWVLICSVILTNMLHSLVFRVTVHPDKEYTRGFFYFVILFWMIFLGAGTLFVLLKKCSLQAPGKLWYIPAHCAFFGLFLLIWYLIIGGSPKLFGHKLFQLQ